MDISKLRAQMGIIAATIKNPVVLLTSYPKLSKIILSTSDTQHGYVSCEINAPTDFKTAILNSSMLSAVLDKLEDEVNIKTTDSTIILTDNNSRVTLPIYPDSMTPEAPLLIDSLVGYTDSVTVAGESLLPFLKFSSESGPEKTSIVITGEEIHLTTPYTWYCLYGGIITKSRVDFTIPSHVKDFLKKLAIHDSQVVFNKNASSRLITVMIDNKDSGVCWSMHYVPSSNYVDIVPRLQELKEEKLCLVSDPVLDMITGNGLISVTWKGKQNGDLEMISTYQPDGIHTCTFSTKLKCSIKPTRDFSYITSPLVSPYKNPISMVVKNCDNQLVFIFGDDWKIWKQKKV